MKSAAEVPYQFVGAPSATLLAFAATPGIQTDEDPYAETRAVTTERLYHFSHHITHRTRQISR